MARVNSFVTGGKTRTTADKDLIKMGRVKIARSIDVLKAFRQAQKEGHKVKNTGPSAWIEDLRKKLKNGEKVDPKEFGKKYSKNKKK